MSGVNKDTFQAYVQVDLDPTIKGLIEQLGHYDVQVETAEGKVTAMTENDIKGMLGQDGCEALYRGTAQTESTDKRQQFILRFSDDLQVQQPKKIEDKLITLKELLGADGLAAYKAAIQEEKNSVAFRNAAFLKSTMLYEGKKWKEPFVMYVLGPSSSGKTFATKTALAVYTKDRPVQSGGEDAGNFVVSVDGGVDRELSQIRQFVLQLALSKGYKGIQDLHSVSTGVKQQVWDAAQAAHLSQIIPATCVDPKESSALTNSMHRCRDKGIEQACLMVQADQETVKRMGENRAWAPVGVDAPTQIGFKKGAVDCESKVYEPEYFGLGVMLSKMKAVRFGRKGAHFLVKNDLIYVQEKTSVGNWVKANPNAKTAGLVRLSERDFETWQALGPDKAPLEVWLKEQQKNKATSKPLVIQGSYDRSRKKITYGGGLHATESLLRSASDMSLGDMYRSASELSTVSNTSTASAFTVASAATATTVADVAEDLAGISFEPIAPAATFGVPAVSGGGTRVAHRSSVAVEPSPVVRNVSPVGFKPIVPQTTLPVLGGWDRICEVFNKTSVAEQLQWQWEHKGKDHHLDVRASSASSPSYKLSVNMTEPVTVNTKVPENPPEDTLAQLKRLVTLSSQLVHEQLVPQDRQAVIYGGKDLANALVLYQKFHAEHPKMPIVWSPQYTAAQQAELNKMLKIETPVATPRSRTGKGTAGG